ncbi:hypothetical protein N7510_005250 [Penicillium lagena]|uniref:uncharacterized protein n=1 Tax=Penicillium lagena TaxID=94218 RepID=UPI00254047BB|nr:uncharacterized protein N7510_005250 [Penicillium lagena]KAJ5612056.1 hypothetical protein N7510_005250 [Penicillium lagena]
MMPRPQVDLEAYQEEIVSLFTTQRTTVEDICFALRQNYGLAVSVRTLQRRLQAWEVRRAPSIVYNEAIQTRIATLCTQAALTTSEILEVLSNEGTPISPRTLWTIRCQRLGIRLRIDDPEEQQQQEGEIEAILADQLGKGHIEGYGRGHLYTYLRRHRYVYVRDRIFKIWCALRPDALQRRSLGLQRARGSYTVPGPNFVWHIDGYMKLQPYGIEVYAAIDGYSRYIVWIYVGISTRTAVSVLRQYLDTLSMRRFQPRAIRVDLGTETYLIGDAHWALRRAIDPDIRHEECWWYGRSVQNQRIESWWGQLSGSNNFVWRKLFRYLQDSGFFTSSTADQIALLAVYMPLVRSSIKEFVETWNTHRIRRQKNRPDSVPGKPWMLFHHPQVQDFNKGVDPVVLSGLHEGVVGDWDADEYLPAETLQWCRTQLYQLGFDPLQPPARESYAQPYTHVYLELRQLVTNHIESGALPILVVSARPTGGYNWVPPGQPAEAYDKV